MLLEPEFAVATGLFCFREAFSLFGSELDPGKSKPPDGMLSRFIYVYNGSIEISGQKVDCGTVAQLGQAEGETLEAIAGESGGDFLFVAGAPIGEPVVQHGPFVMSSREQVRC